MKEFLSFAVERLGISWDMLQRYVQFIFEILENGVVMKLLWSQPKPTQGDVWKHWGKSYHRLRRGALLLWDGLLTDEIKWNTHLLSLVGLVHPSSCLDVPKKLQAIPKIGDEPKFKTQGPATSDFSVCLVSGWWWLEHEFYDFPYIGNNHPNWRTPSFFRRVGLNHQPVIFLKDV